MLRTYTQWTIGPTLAAYLESTLIPGMRTLEFGSGLSTQIFVDAGCSHVALEHDARFAPDLPPVILTRLVGNPPFYENIPAGPFDLILIDGPPIASGGRWGVLRVLPALINEKTCIILDDTNRRQENELSVAIQRAWGMTRHRLYPRHAKDYGRIADVLAPGHIR